MITAEKDWIVSAIETAPGRMKLCFYEKHKIGEPGLTICKELELHEVEDLFLAAFRVCMFQIKNLAP